MGEERWERASTGLRPPGKKILLYDNRIRESGSNKDARSKIKRARCWVYGVGGHENRSREAAFQWSGNGNPVVVVKAANRGI
jgi:hypothetical protein